MADELRARSAEAEHEVAEAGSLRYALMNRGLHITGSGLSMDSPERSRIELELAWQERVRRASCRYRAESERSSQLSIEYSPSADFTTDSDTVLRQARERESAALKDYMRALRIFAELVVYGIVPNEDP